MSSEASQETGERMTVWQAFKELSWTPGAGYSLAAGCAVGWAVNVLYAREVIQRIVEICQ